MKRFLMAAVCVGVLAVTGCTTEARLSTQPRTTTSAAASVPSDTPAQATPTPTLPAPPAAPSVATFGDTVKLPSGLSFTLAYVGMKPALHYTDSGKYSGKTAVFKLSVMNGTKQPVDASAFLFELSATAGADGHQVAANGWDDYTWPKLSTILPGETQSTETGYDAVQAAGGLRVAIQVPQYLGGGQVPVVWKGDIK